MKKVPMPTFEDLDDEVADDAEDAFYDKVGQADWKESPESILKTVDQLLKEHGLEIRIYDAKADSVFFDLAKRS